MKATQLGFANIILQLNQMNTKVYLPFLGEFGWYIICFVKRIHGDTATRKIVCCKRGHECLFPTATDFYYEWEDIADGMKAGIHPDFSHEEVLKERITKHFNLLDVEWSSPSANGWHDKLDYYNHNFIPKPLLPYDLQADVIITPRNRTIDSYRNWTKDNWQFVVDQLYVRNISVAVCGAKDSTFELSNVKYKSYNYTDVDSDVELMTNAKLIITQESGLQYLAFLCQKPVMCIDHYHGADADLFREKHIPFKEIPYVWNEPKLLVQEIEFFLNFGKTI